MHGALVCIARGDHAWWFIERRGSARHQGVAGSSSGERNSPHLAAFCHSDLFPRWGVNVALGVVNHEARVLQVLVREDGSVRTGMVKSRCRNSQTVRAAFGCAQTEHEIGYLGGESGAVHDAFELDSSASQTVNIAEVVGDRHFGLCIRVYVAYSLCNQDAAGCACGVMVQRSIHIMFGIFIVIVMIARLRS